MEQKNKLVFIFVIFLSTVTQAQLAKNTWLFGGSGSFYSYKRSYFYDTGLPNNVGTARYTDIDVTASAGLFVIDKLALGLISTFSSLKGASSGGGETNGHRFSIGPYARYYFLNEEKAFNLLSEISYQLGINKYAGPSKNKGKFNTFSIMGGPEIFFNSTIGMEILIGYKATTISIDKPSDRATSDISKGFQMSVGFRVHLEKL